MEHRKIKPSPVPAHELGRVAIDRAEEVTNQTFLRILGLPQAAQLDGGLSAVIAPKQTANRHNALEVQRQKPVACFFLPAIEYMFDKCILVVGIKFGGELSPGTTQPLNIRNCLEIKNQH
jgi:hypothetical protein